MEGISVVATPVDLHVNLAELAWISEEHTVGVGALEENGMQHW